MLSSPPVTRLLCWNAECALTCLPQNTIAFQSLHFNAARWLLSSSACTWCSSGNETVTFHLSSGLTPGLAVILPQSLSLDSSNQQSGAHQECEGGLCSSVLVIKAKGAHFPQGNIWLEFIWRAWKYYFLDVMISLLWHCRKMACRHHQKLIRSFSSCQKSSCQ